MRLAVAHPRRWRLLECLARNDYSQFVQLSSWKRTSSLLVLSTRTASECCVLFVLERPLQSAVDVRQLAIGSPHLKLLRHRRRGVALCSSTGTPVDDVCFFCLVRRQKHVISCAFVDCRSLLDGIAISGVQDYVGITISSSVGPGFSSRP